MARTSVSVHGGASAQIPEVFNTPIRPDLVQHIYTNISKNSMQPHATDPRAGSKNSAVSWGPGRAKARVPRVNGSGSNRNGQGAYANFCRGGHRFGPPTLQRRWFRAVPFKQRKYAIASAIAATAIPSLVMARGHKIDNAKELPIVIAESFNAIKKTKEAVALLKEVGAYADVERVIEGKIHRASKGKFRRSAFKTRKGPLVVYSEDNGIVKAFRNIPGVDTAKVTELTLTQLAPGAQLGRLTIWTEGAFAAIDGVFKNDPHFNLPRSILTNQDLDRVYKSDEVQDVLRPKLSVVPLPKKRCEETLSLASDAWAAALREVAEIKEADEKRLKTPEAIKALFADVMANEPETPKNISRQLLDYQL